MGLLNFPVLILSFIIGLVLVFIQPIEHKTIFVYPTPTNVDKIQYKDEVDNCYMFSARLVDCNSASKISKIPPQK
jgi:hypothetical protein